MDAFHDLKHRRLTNWGRYVWRALMEDRPDGSCVNSIYQLGGDDLNEGHGEIDGNTVLAPQLEPAKAEQEDIDEDDAESLDVTIAQIHAGHRIVLQRVYVLRGRKGSPAVLDAAIRAISEAGDATKRVHDYMRGKV